MLIVLVVLSFATGASPSFDNRTSYGLSDTTSSSYDSIVGGFITDSETNARLGGATLIFDGQPSATSDARGFFRFTVTGGMHVIEARVLGYESVRKVIEVDSSEEFVQVFFALNVQPIQMEGVVITREQQRLDRKQEDIVTRKPAELKSIPKFIEPDPIRAIQALPGVTTATSDFNAQVYLRGGNFDETMIFLDEVPIYNPYHFAGWLSTFNTDIVQEEKIFLSNYPVTMGGFLSGAVSLYTKNPNNERYTGSVSLALSTVRGSIEGPLGPGALLLSARRTFLDAAVNAIAGKEGIPFFFYDVDGKYALPINERMMLNINAFASRDGFNLFESSKSKTFSSIKDEPRWNNNAFSVDVRHTLNNNAVVSAMVYFSRSSLIANGQGTKKEAFAIQQQVLRIDNSITDFGGRIKLDLSNGRSDYSVGVEAKRLQMKYDWDIIWNGYSDTEEILFPKPESFFDYAEQSFQYLAATSVIDGFAMGTFRLTGELAVTLGYRAEYVSSLKRVLHSPYVRATYDVTQNLLFTAGCGSYYQYLYTIKESKTPDNFFNQFATYFLANASNQTAKSNHVVAGVQLKDFVLSTTMDIELFYKARENLASSYNDPAQRYRFEDGTSIGMDMLLKGQEGPLTYWLGYSLLGAVKDNGSFRYFANYDRTHSLKIFLAYAPSENWAFNLLGTYGSGVPYTSVVGEYVGLENERGTADEFMWRPIEGSKNSARTSNYRRLDLGVTGSFIWDELYVKPYLQVFNVLNSANPYFYNFRKEEQRASNIMPIVGLTVEF